jgi:hypothetical protein
MRQGVGVLVCQSFSMTDTKLRFSPLPKEELAPRDDELLLRFDVAQRWKCSEKSVERAESRLGLRPIRVLRGIRYRLSNVLQIEEAGFTRMPRKWTGLRPSQKAELEQEREEFAQQSAMRVLAKAPPAAR